MAVGEDLDLDVAAIEDQALEHQRAVAEGALRFTAGADDGLGQLVVLVDQTHAAPATAADGLDQQRVAQALAFGHQDLVILVGPQVAGRGGHTGLDHLLLGASLVPHHADGFGRGADEDDARIAAGLGEAGVLGQETVAGVDGIGAGLAAGGQQHLALEVGLGSRGRTDADGLVSQADVRRLGIGLAVHGHCAVAQLAGGADDAASDFAAVGNEDLVDHDGRHLFSNRLGNP